jgi:hypothetical protein
VEDDSATTVLSALIFGKEIADGLVSINIFAPTVVAPKEVLPVAGVKPVEPPSHLFLSVYAVSQLAELSVIVPQVFGEIFFNKPDVQAPSAIAVKSASSGWYEEDAEDVVKYEDKSEVKATVPVAFGKVIVLSAVGSVIASVVSYASAVAPSNIRLPFNSISFFTTKLMLANEVHYPLNIIIAH